MKRDMSAVNRLASSERRADSRFHRLLRSRQVLAWPAAVRLLVVLTLLLGGGLAGRAWGALVTAFNYPDFSAPAGVGFFNAATPVAGVAQLTPAAPGRNGSAIHSAAVALRDGFDTEFQFRILNPGGDRDADGVPGGDGLALIIQGQGPTATGLTVGYIPYSIPNAVALEFDTWRNSNLSDPDGNHLSVQDVGPTPNGLAEFHHNRSLGWSAAGLNLSDGAVHVAHVQYRPGLLQVFLDGAATPTLAANLDLANIGGRSPLLADGSAWLGFAAGTGAAYEGHEIVSWSFQAVVPVVNQAPVADAGGPYTINQGNPLVLGGSGTDPDADDSLTFAWDLNNDGAFGDATGATPTLSASALQILGLGFGAHPIQLRVTDSHGAAATASTTLMIRGTQTITFDTIGMRVLGSAPFPMWAYADSGLPVTLTSLTPSVATVDGDIVTLVGLGTATIRASQAGDADWQPAPDVELTFEVWKPSSLWAWGSGSQGRLGTGERGLSTVPQAVGAPPGWDGHTVTSVTVGEAHTLALLDDGSVWAWGFNDYGGLGNGQTSGSYVAVAVSAPTAWNGHRVVSVAAGGVHSLAVLDDGSAWAWGRNIYGQLGNGQTGDSSVPVPVLTPTAWNGHKVVRIAAGRYNHSLAVLDDGSVWAWGSGYHGQLGNGSTVDSSVPVAVAAPVAWNGRKVVSVTAGNVHRLAVLDDGSIWAWGHGAFGQLGNGQTSNSSVPVQISAPVAWTGHTVVNVTAGGFHNLAVLDDGSAWAWGANWNGQLGNGQTANSSVPVPVLAPAAWTGRRVVSVAAETQHSLAVLDDGSVWAWGRNDNGELGNGQTANSSVPAPVSAPAAWSGQKAVSVGAGNGFSVALLSTLNSAPTLVNPLANQNATYGAPFTFSVPANTFADADAGQTLSYSASGLPAWLAFDADSRTFSGTPTVPGSFTLTVTATDDGTPALSASTTFDLVVGKAPLAATGDTLYRFYGEENPPLTGTLEGVVNGDNITASYSTTATPTGAAGVYTIYVTLNDPDSRLGNYEVTLVTGALRVERAPQTITFGPIPPHDFGDAPFTVPVSASSGLPVTLTSSAASVATVSGTTLTITGAGATLLTAYQPGDGNFQAAAFVQVSYTVGKATPVITWATPAPITSSTPLSGAQLNATANVPGSFAYTPAAGTTLPRGTHVLSAEFTPGDAANYTSASATVSLEVLNSAPVATGQAVTTPEDTAVTVTLSGSDVDGDALTYTVTSNPAHGTLSGTVPNLTYTPTANYNGTDSFTFKVNDGTVDSELATVSIEVLPVNDSPVAFDRVVTTLEDTPIDVRLDGNDTEASGYRTLFSFASGRGEYPTAPLVQGVDGLLYGTASGDENGQGVVFRIAPDGSGYAVLHRFTPWASPFAGLLVGSDGFLYGTTRQGGTGPGTVYRLRPDGADFEIVHAFEGGVNAGFAPEAGVIEGADGFLYGTTYQGNSGAAGTVFRLAKDGSDFGVLYTFGLTAGDGRNPDAPVVQGPDGALYGTTRWGGSQNYGSIFRLDPNAPMDTRVRLLHSFQGGVADGREPLSGGLVLGGDGLLYGTTWLGGADNNGVLFRIGTDGTGYAILRQMTGVDGIRPKGGLLWGSDGALYGAAEQGGRSGGGTVFRLMPDGSDFRVLWNLSASGSGARYPVGKLLEGDDGLLYGAGNRGGDNNVGALFALAKAPQGLTFTVLQSPAHGTLSGTPPALTYTPAPDFSGSDYFTFEVNDGTVNSATATVTIIVTPVNDLPVANSQSITTAEDTAVAVTLGGSDADANALSYSVVSGPAHGTLLGTAPNLSYTPTANYHGPDSFTFKVNDGSVDSVPATVAITVTSVNDAPVDRDRSVGVLEDNGGGQVQPQVDVDGDPVTYFVVTPPQHGRVESQGGNLIYLPDPNYHGPDSYTFKAKDGTLESPLYTYTITVLPVNDAPTVAAPLADFAVNEDAPNTVLALGSVFTDIDTGGTDLTYSVQANSNPGLVSATVDNVTDSLTLRYAANQFGTATLTLRATDSGGLFAEDTLVVTVQPVSDGDPGDLDLAFDPGVDGEIYGLALQPDAKILMAGNFTSVGGVTRPYVVRLNADGTLDPGFNARPNSQVHSALVQPDGSIILRGSFTAVDGVARNGVARVRSNGALDPDFNPAAVGWVQSAALQADGKVLLGGSFTSVGGVTRNRIARVEPSGALDAGFNPGADNEVIGIAVQTDGKIVLVGRFSTVSGSASPYVARLNPDGTRDAGFNPNVNAPVLCAALQADGKLLIGGFFDRVDGVSRYAIARLNADGSLDSSFNANLTSNPTSLAMLEDGRIMVGGYFTQVNGAVRNGIARLNPDGTLDATFAGAVDNRGVHGIALQPDGKVLLAGQFMTVGGEARRGIARLDSDPASQGLNVSGPNRVEWVRGGAPPEVHQAIFELSTDGGTTWSSLGAGTRIAGGWEKSGLTLSGYGWVRARASVASGYNNGSSGQVGSLAAFEFDHPPVAVAGADQQVVAGTDCLATVTVDGGASSDADGDALSFSWQLFLNGELIDTVAGPAAVSWSLTHGTYEAVLTVSTDKNGTTVSRSDSLVIEVLPSAPALAALSPASAYAGGPGFTLTLTGGCFLPGAVVHWNGQPRTTTVVGSSELVAAIPASDLLTGVDIAVASVQVVNGDGQVSNPLGFSVVAQTVGTADAAITEPGESSTVSTAPATSGEPGVTVTVQNNGDQAVSVLAASYDERPVGETAFQVDNGAFVDVQVAGADENVAATVFFYYPSTTTGGMENRVRLRYFDGANWMEVFSSRRRPDGTISPTNVPPVLNTDNNLDGTVSGGRFTVVFDDTSTPTIMALTGTVFGMFESQPQLGAITGPTGPVALGNPVGVTANFAVVGDPADATVRFLWDDGTESTVAPTTATSATATHLYAAPGVYGVTVQVMDVAGDVSEGRFEYVVIYDPNGGFVTGGGWLESAPGAYLYDPTLTGKATFGFNSKYLKGQSVPTGQTQFQFQAGDFKFHSTAYEWLVVAGAKAQYKGVGQVNGTGDCGFLLTATDGQIIGGGGTDRFRIKIWDRATGAVVYDNRRGASDDVDAADPQVINGGSIVIQRGK